MLYIHTAECNTPKQVNYPKIHVSTQMNYNKMLSKEVRHKIIHAV